MPETFSFIKGWENFYVIAGSSASTLTGLTFVVIALASDGNMVNLTGLRAFMTPIVIHFGAVLWVACVMSIPGHNALSLAISLTATAIVLTIYSIVIIRRMYANRVLYVPAMQDWIWNATLPLLACLTLLASGGLITRHAVPALYLVGVVTLVMLFIGVHNAWDLAVWIIAERPSKQRERESQQAAGTPPPERP